MNERDHEFPPRTKAYKLAYKAVAVPMGPILVVILPIILAFLLFGGTGSSGVWLGAIATGLCLALVGVGVYIDSSVASSAEAVVQVANENGIPIITNDIPTLAKGGSVAVGASLREDGRLAGEMAEAFLDGDIDLATTDIQRVGIFDYFNNRAGAEAQGIDLPQSLLDRAIDQTP